MSELRNTGSVGFEAREEPLAAVKKPWRSPRVIVSEAAQTENASNPPTTDGTPASQVS
jgi:hypothetical protein